MSGQDAGCPNPMNWWMLIWWCGFDLNLDELLDRLVFAECTDCSGNTNVKFNGADCFQGKPILVWAFWWPCEKENHILVAEQIPEAFELLARVAWGFLIWISVGCTPSIDRNPWIRIEKSNFAGIPLIKIPRKNAAHVRYSHQFSADFPNFPPTSSSPLLQFHLAKDRQQKQMPGEWPNPGN